MASTLQTDLSPGEALLLESYLKYYSTETQTPTRYAVEFSSTACVIIFNE